MQEVLAGHIMGHTVSARTGVMRAVNLKVKYQRGRKSLVKNSIKKKVAKPISQHVPEWVNSLYAYCKDTYLRDFSLGA